MKIALDSLIANPKNRQINEQKVQEYVASIRINGLLQDPLVQPMDDKTYMILSGHHRIAACRRLAKEDSFYNAIECKVTMPDLDNLRTEMALIDGNLNSPLTAYEKVISIGRKEEILKKLAIDHKDEMGKGKGSLRDIIAAQISLQSTQVGKYLRIYKRASTEVLTALKEERISFEEAAKLCKYEKEKQVLLLQSRKQKKQKQPNDIFIEDLRTRVQQRLGTKVQFQKHKMEITYVDIDDLNRILEELHLLEQEDE